jgi:hypothetical protein
MFRSLVSLHKVVMHNVYYLCPDAAAKEGCEFGKVSLCVEHKFGHSCISSTHSWGKRKPQHTRIYLI